ncbi:MAG: hypothetical protein QM740_12695 [Acidovorax sp.]
MIALLGPGDEAASEAPSEAASLAQALQRRLAPGMAVAASAAPVAASTLTLLLSLPDQPAWETQCRAQLQLAGQSFQVLYGRNADERLLAALRAIHTALPGALREPPADRALRLRAWACEKCSDPECEHRLFTALRDSA